MLKKFFIIVVSIILMIGMCGSVNAAELKTSLDVVTKASETKYLENNQGFISKTIVDSNKDTGEVTIELKLSNTKKETVKSNATEIMLVIDNSISMDFKTAEGKSRKSIILNSARNFVNNVFNTSLNVKIGVVKFCGESGIWAPAYAASLITKPTSNKDEVLKGLQTLENKSTESGTNIQKGLIKAEESFSKDAKNKVIILLTDGCPNEDAKKNNVSDSGMVMKNEKYNTILNNTKNELLNIEENGTMLISLMTGVNSNDVDEYGNVITSTEDNLQAIETIFGTEDNPTAGKFYNAKTADVNKVISENITSDVQSILYSPLNTVKIVDYFPEDITDNFEFSYVGKPTVGTTSDAIDPEENTITWDIGTLKGNEVATLKYKLKIKDMKNEELLNKTIATNEKVVLTYKDKDSKDYTVELTSSPKIKLSEVKEALKATLSYDPTTTTTGTVTATIKTNKKVEKVDGWKLSEDGMTLTKKYSKNETEKVKLVAEDGTEKTVTVKVSNIKAKSTKTNSSSKNKTTGKKDNTVSPTILPQTGLGRGIMAIVVIATVYGIYAYHKYNYLKDIK